MTAGTCFSPLACCPFFLLVFSQACCQNLLQQQCAGIASWTHKLAAIDHVSDYTRRWYQNKRGINCIPNALESNRTEQNGTITSRIKHKINQSTPERGEFLCRYMLVAAESVVYLFPSLSADLTASCRADFEWGSTFGPFLWSLILRPRCGAWRASCWECQERASGREQGASGREQGASGRELGASGRELGASG